MGEIIKPTPRKVHNPNRIQNVSWSMTTKSNSKQAKQFIYSIFVNTHFPELQSQQQLKIVENVLDLWGQD